MVLIYILAAVRALSLATKTGMRGQTAEYDWDLHATAGSKFSLEIGELLMP